MIRLLIVAVIIIVILFIIRSHRIKTDSNKSDTYKKIILIFVIAVILIFLVTSGKFILPQILQILKVALPFLTKFIGI